MKLMGTMFDLLWIIVKLLWPLYVIVGAVFVIRIIFEVLLPKMYHRWRQKIRFRKGEEWRTDQELLKWLRDMKPSEFEDYVADLFRRMGFTATAVGKSHDGGIDVIAKKDSTKHYIQCKKYYRSKVSVHDMRDFYGALADHLADGKGYFITTNVFTREAEVFAEDKPIQLVNGSKLVRWIREFASGEAKTQDIPSRICPKCGGSLVMRNGKRGEFYGCSNFPKCHHTESV